MIEPPEPPGFEVLSGSPTPEEEAAIRAAILKLWRDERAEAARAGAASRWTVAARAAATGNGVADLRRRAGGASAWRLSLRLAGVGLLCARRTGRGDSR